MVLKYGSTLTEKTNKTMTTLYTMYNGINTSQTKVIIIDSSNRDTCIQGIITETKWSYLFFLQQVCCNAGCLMRSGLRY